MLCAHSLQGVVSLGGLTAQHDAVVAIQHGVGNITGLSASRAGFLGHALQHLRRDNNITLRQTFFFVMFFSQNSRPTGVTDLCGADDGLSDPVAPAGHHLLGEEDLLCWDFNAQVSAGNHDAVTSLQDLIESMRQKEENQFQKFSKDLDLLRFTDIVHSPAHTLVVLELADDLDVLALLAKRLPDGLNVSSLTDEGGEDHVNTLLHAELQVLQVLIRESG